jgi:sugar phosphate isomerase/epimerase
MHNRPMQLSVQLYTLRNLLAVDLEGTLSSVREMGIRHVELAGLYTKTAEEWSRMLKRLELSVSGSHIGMDRLEEDLDGAIEECKALGCKFLIVPWIDVSRYGGWAAFGKALEPIGHHIADRGLLLAYHNHAFEFSLEAGQTGLDAFFAAADPELVFAQIDVGWVQHAGHDPAQLIRKLGPRCKLVHLKDTTGNPEFLDVEAGRGLVDWDAVLSACLDAGVLYGTIELDECPNEPLASVRMSHEFLEAKLRDL